jgi:hypothetical protein
MLRRIGAKMKKARTPDLLLASGLINPIDFVPDYSDRRPTPAAPVQQQAKDTPTGK